MYIVISKKATKDEIKKALDKFEKMRTQKKGRKSKGNVAKHFGSNPGETDGLKFQKKIRGEWD